MTTVAEADAEIATDAPDAVTTEVQITESQASAEAAPESTES